eukprot:3522521-Amphidinium_carterae.1
MPRFQPTVFHIGCEANGQGYFFGQLFKSSACEVDVRLRVRATSLKMRAFCMRSGCDTTTPCAQLQSARWGSKLCL